MAEGNEWLNGNLPRFDMSAAWVVYAQLSPIADCRNGRHIAILPQISRSKKDISYI
jgi:hypothetical protein